jgi:tetratricopeptide (TPR) repeat protein
MALLSPLSVTKALEKELKRPDEFVSFWTHLGQKIGQYRRGVIALLVTAGVCIAGGWGWTAYRSSAAAKATAAFERIARVANAELLPEKEPEKASPTTAPSDVQRFKTEQQRLEEANKEADAFLAQFGSDGLGRKVLVDKAARLVVLGNPAEAAAIYERLAANETDHGLRVIALEGVAVAREAEGKLDDALRAYTSLADECQRGSKFFLDRALFSQARILEKQGKRKDAEKILREILDKVPKTSLRSQIDDRLALLTEK